MSTVEEKEANLEKNLILAMSYIQDLNPVPTKIAKNLIASMCWHRAEAQWITSLLQNVLVENCAATAKAEKLMSEISGTFGEEDSVFMEAYIACRDNVEPKEKFTKDSAILVRGDKSED